MGKEIRTGIACPKCGVVGNDRVVDSRWAEQSIRRRRECVCGNRFTTYERIEKTHLPELPNVGSRWGREGLGLGIVRSSDGVCVVSHWLDLGSGSLNPISMTTTAEEFAALNAVRLVEEE